ARPFLCLLLAVSTALGAAVPARACGCASPKPSDAKSAPQARLAAPAPKSCCQAAGEKRSCCSKGRDAAKSACGCSERARPNPGDRPAPADNDRPGCECVRCDCGTPAIPAAPPAPTQLTADAVHLALDSAVPPAFVPPPQVAD